MTDSLAYATISTLAPRIASREVSPVDIAEAVTFLSSPGAGGLHGNVLRVCGGNLLGA